MSVPHPRSPLVQLDRALSKSTEYRRVSTGATRPGEALLRVSPDGVCLEVLPYDQFDPLPPPSSLLGALVSQALPRELGMLVSSEVSAGGLHRRVREVTSAGYRLRVDISPTRDGTCWVRLRDMSGTDPSTNRRERPRDDAREADRGIVQTGGTNHAAFRLGDDGRIADWNASAAGVSGLPADAAVGRLFSELSEEGEGWESQAKQALTAANEGAAEFEAWLWQRGGRRVYVAVTLARDGGQYWATLRDVTARRLRDNRAAALYAVGRAALDANDVDDLTRRTLTAMCHALDWEVGLFWEVDSSAGRLRCRRGVRAGEKELAGVTTDDGRLTLAHGQGLAGRVWVADKPDTTQAGFDSHPVFAPARLSNTLRSGFAFPIRGRAGTLGVFEFATRAVETQGAELLRTVAIIGNHVSQLSDRFRAEHALRESDAEKAAILSNALDGIIRVDGDGRIVELNAAAERTFGCEHLAMLGRDLPALLVDRADQAKLRVELTALTREEADSAASGRRLQVRATRANGDEFPVDLAVTRIPLAGPPHFSVCVRDLSEQERLQDALHHSQKMESLGVLASGIAHDFNNFLTVIRGQAERLVKNLTEDDDRRRWVKSILKVSERASALTGQLLAFGRREAGRVSVVDLNAVIESTAGLLSQQLGDRVVWKTALSPRTGAARVGEGQVQQILFNLALNACDAMPDGGTLRVGTGNVDLGAVEARRLLLTPGPYVRLSVTDTGRGMNARTQSRVFEPFFTTKKLGDGTGLGLSTVYAIVQQCGGQISVSSRVGEGTTFDLYFPRVSEGTALAVRPPELSTIRALAGLTVLLVEDEDEIREIIRAALEEHGCAVIEAANGMVAMERCAQHEGPIHLLLTDMIMPGMNGHQLAERFVRLRPETPVMFVSGHPEAEVGDDTLIGRNVALLRKPFSSDELIEKVIQVVEPPAGLHARLEREPEPRPDVRSPMG